MGKAPFCEKDGLKRGPWTAEEDLKLIDYIQKHGHGKWRTLPKNAGLRRCGKSCRLRWTNYLRPDIKRGKFSLQEEETIIQLHSVLGNKWSAIASRLPGRTDNEIKNYWNTNLKKRLMRMGIDPVTHVPLPDILRLSSILNSPTLNNLPFSVGTGQMLNPNLLNMVSALLSSQNLQQNQIGNKFLQNQIQPNSQHPILSSDLNQFQSPIHDMQARTESNTSSSPLLAESQFMQPKLQQFCSNFSEANLGNQNGDQHAKLAGSFVPPPSDYGFDHSDHFITSQFPEFTAGNIENLPSLSFSSAVPTPTSSMTPLNSSSNTTYANGSCTEDERDSFCSRLLMYGIPSALSMDGII